MSTGPRMFEFENLHNFAIYPALVLFEQANCIDWINFCNTDRNLTFSGTLSTYYLLSFANLIVNPVHFLLTENIKIYYLIQNINVNELM